LGEEVPVPHVFVPATEIFPDEALEEKLTIIEFVFVPAVIVAPKGNVHVYPVALVIAPTE